MAVKRTESDLPPGFQPEDLGQAAVVRDTSGAVQYALVSYLTSPIAVGSTIDYVVFVRGVAPDGSDDYEYEWTITDPVGDGDHDTKDRGVFEYRAENVGIIDVEVKVLRSRASIATLTLKQCIVPLNPALEILLEGGGSLDHLGVNASIGALGGDEDASRELINNFRTYVFDATDPKKPNRIDIPTRFLAALTYAKVMGTAKSGLLGREAELAAAAAELNGDSSMSFGAQIDNALGVCQIKPQTLAMVVTRPGGNTPYTPWTDLPANPDQREPIAEQILERLDRLADAAEVKVHLFNLLRFPKTNIRMCAALLRRLVDRNHRWLNAAGSDLFADKAALRILATEFYIGGTLSPLASGTGTPSPTSAKPNDFGLRVVDKIMAIPALALSFMSHDAVGAAAYGGYDLRRGDSDPTRRWEGEVRVAPAGPADHVLQLQTDLRALGFTTLIGSPDGTFGRHTEWAVREFQIHARMRFVASEAVGAGSYLSRLTQTANVLPYAGPISGVANLATRVSIQYWKANGWRCPVIIGAYNSAGTTLFNNAENIWLEGDAMDTSQRMFATDFSGYYDYAGAWSNAQPKKFMIGRWTDQAWHGPVSLWNDCDDNSEVTSDNLLGKAYDTLSDAEKSTFRVIRAVAENENLAFFDSITAYDRAIISSGVCHWTIALVQPNGTVLNGELCAYLCYLKSKDPGAFQKAVGNFGIDVATTWKRNGTGLFDPGERKYAGWFQRQDESSEFVDYPRTKDDVLYLASWHWFYRFVMAGRVNPAYCRYMWDMARFRIRDVRETPFDAAAAIPRVSDNGSKRTARIKDVFTSEKATAMLYRWHIYSPVEVVSNGRATDVVTAAVTESGVPLGAGDAAPATWTTAHEELLIAKLKEKVDAVATGASDPLQDTVGKAMAWPNYANRTTRGYSFGGGVAPLSGDRGSFRFLDGDLPASL